MYIQPITQQMGFNGKLVIEKDSKSKINEVIALNKLDSKFDEIASIMKDKPYDLFMFKNKQNPDFYNIAANKSLKKAKAVKEYTVKIQSSIMAASIVDAAKDAIEMFENYISKIALKK